MFELLKVGRTYRLRHNITGVESYKLCQAEAPGQKRLQSTKGNKPAYGWYPEAQFNTLYTIVEDLMYSKDVSLGEIPETLPGPLDERRKNATVQV